MIRRTGGKRGYTKGQINKLIDSIVHPLAKRDEPLLVLDGFLHALVERSPSLSTKKFLVYNIPTLMSHLAEDRKTAKMVEHFTRDAMKLTEEQMKSHKGPRKRKPS